MPRRHLCTWNLIKTELAFVCTVLLSPVMKTIKMFINDNHNQKYLADYCMSVFTSSGSTY